jgi:hypothetical protein
MGIDSKYGVQVRKNLWAEKGLYKFGYNASVGTASETIWDGGGVYSYPASASVMKVSSDNTGDTSTVTVSGLDADYNEASEQVTITGQTAVSTTTSFIRVNRVKVDSGEPTGNIYVGTGTVSAGVPANIFAKINAGENQTLMAVWTVPAGYTAYILAASVASGTSSVNKYSEARLKVRPFGGVFQTKEVITFQNTYVETILHMPAVVTEKSDIEIRALTSSSTDAISATFTIVYEKN